MSVSGVNGSQNQAFVDLVNRPQTAYANAPQPMYMAAQPQADVYQGPKQEEKKGSFLGKVFKTLIFAAAVVGLNRVAHKTKLIQPVKEGATGFVNKYIRKPLNNVDEWVLKTWQKYFNKAAAKTDGSDAAAAV